MTYSSKWSSPSYYIAIDPKKDRCNERFYEYSNSSRVELWLYALPLAPPGGRPYHRNEKKKNDARTCSSSSSIVSRTTGIGAKLPPLLKLPSLSALSFPLPLLLPIRCSPPSFSLRPQLPPRRRSENRADISFVIRESTAAPHHQSCACLRVVGFF